MGLSRRWGFLSRMGLLLLLFSVPSFAVEPLIVPQGLNGKPVGLHMDLLRDSEGRLGIEDVSQGPESARFITSQKESPNLGYTKDAV